jgi:hypothetical protein
MNNQDDNQQEVKFKHCNKCNRDLPANNQFFGNRKQWKDGLEYYCKECNKKDRDRYYSNPEKLAQCNEKKKIRANAKKAWYRDFKRFPCVDCGIQYDPELMDFDHIKSKGKKLANVSRLVLNNAPKQRILDEIDKCELVCVYCHFKRTHNRIMAKAKPFEKYSIRRQNKILKKEEIDKLKESQPCCVCKQHFPFYQLQWDHIDPNLKVENVSRLINNNCSKEVIYKEIENCQVICVKCHRLKSLYEPDEVITKSCSKCKKNKNISNFKEYDEKLKVIENKICKSCRDCKFD